MKATGERWERIIVADEAILREWPRSTAEDGFSKPTKMSGTATGIVRRVEECVIIGQKLSKHA